MIEPAGYKAYVREDPAATLAVVREVLGTYSRPSDEHRHFLAFIALGETMEALPDEGTALLAQYARTYVPGPWRKGQDGWDDIRSLWMFASLVNNDWPEDRAGELVALALSREVHPAVRDAMIAAIGYFGHHRRAVVLAAAEAALAMGDLAPHAGERLRRALAGSDEPRKRERHRELLARLVR